VAARYSGHSFWLLHDSVVRPNVTLLPMTLSEAYKHLSGRSFRVVFIDGDHSLLGIAQDLAISIALAEVGATILCHDVADTFPAVPLVVGAMERGGILAYRERVGDLVRYEIISRPAWLLDPSACCQSGTQPDTLER
jgi:hypothetical protein